MPQASLHHVALMAPAEVIEATMRFYRDLLGLAPGWRPPFAVPGYWLYSGETPVLHLTVNAQRRPGDTGYIHHLALRCHGLADAEARLQQAGVPYRRVDVDDVGQVQLVLRDPAGTPVELNFLQHEQATADAVASTPR